MPVSGILDIHRASGSGVAAQHISDQQAAGTGNDDKITFYDDVSPSSPSAIAWLRSPLVSIGRKLRP